MPISTPLINPHTRRLICAAARIQQLLDAGRLLLRVDPARPGVVEAFDELGQARDEAEKFYLSTVSLSPFMRHQMEITLSAPLTRLVAHLYNPRWTFDLDAVLWSSDCKTAQIAIELLEWYARRGSADPVFQRLGARLHEELLAELTAQEAAHTPTDTAPAPSVIDRLLSMLPRRATKAGTSDLGIFPARHG